MSDEKRNDAQNIILENRRKLSVSGVMEVESFDEKQIVLKTTLGNLTIKGDGLHINRLSVETGDAVIDGTADSLVYSKAKPDESFFVRLLK